VFDTKYFTKKNWQQFPANLFSSQNL